MLNLWGEEEQPTLEVTDIKNRKEAGNPLIALYGPGPEGALCRDCIHFLHIHYHDKNYTKCDHRRLTHGAGSDHRGSWAACAKFDKGKGKRYDIDGGE